MCVQFSFILESRLTTTALLILRYRWEMNGKLAGWTAMAVPPRGGLAKLFAKKFGLAQLGTLAQAGGACRTAWLLATLAPTCGAISPSDVANLPGFPAGRAICCWQEWPAALLTAENTCACWGAPPAPWTAYESSRLGLAHAFNIMA